MVVSRTEQNLSEAVTTKMSCPSQKCVKFDDSRGGGGGGEGK